MKNPESPNHGAEHSESTFLKRNRTAVFAALGLATAAALYAGSDLDEKDRCAGIKIEGENSVTVKPGEEAQLEASGYMVQLGKGATQVPTKYVVKKLIADNAQRGFESSSGINIVAVNAEQEMKNNGNGECVPNEVKVAADGIKISAPSARLP